MRIIQYFVDLILIRIFDYLFLHRIGQRKVHYDSQNYFAKSQLYHGIKGIHLEDQTVHRSYLSRFIFIKTFLVLLFDFIGQNTLEKTFAIFHRG